MRIQAGLQSVFGRRVVSFAGAVCVAASFALLSPGVRIARAEDGAASPVMTPATSPSPAAAPVADPDAAPTVDPGAAPDTAQKSSPFVKAEDVEQAQRPGVSGIEISPGVVVLNTRGYNYGPPPTPLAPEALEQEQAPR